MKKKKVIYIEVSSMKNKSKITIIGLLFIFVFIFLIPNRINYIYLQGYDLNIDPNTMFSASDWLGFLGSILTFIGTAVLGIASLIQNDKLHKMNIQLENQRYILENALVLIPTNEIFDVKWKMHKMLPKNDERIQDQVFLELINNKSNQINKAFQLDGEIILQTTENVFVDYKINTFKLTFINPCVEQTNFIFITKNDFKKAQTIRSNCLKLHLGMFFGTYNWRDQEEIQLLKDDYKIEIETNLNLKNNNIVSEYFVLIRIEPNYDLLQDDHSFFLTKHKMICTAIMKSKDPYILKDLTHERNRPHRPIR
jgi:hypothetical protein